MPPRAQQLILVGLGALVVVGLALLAMEASSEQEIDVDETELARARARAPRPPRPTPSVQPRTRVEDDDGDEDEAEEEDEQDVWKAAKKRPSIPQPGLANTVRPKGKVELSPGTEDFVLAMDDANKLYDRGDYIGSLEAAEELLEVQPNNVRMLRIAVSSSCILGNHEDAGSFYDRLPARDQRQMSRRCRRYGVEFE